MLQKKLVGLESEVVSYSNYLSEVELEIEKKDKEIEVLKNNMAVDEKNIESLEVLSDGKSFRQRLIKLLLENPTVVSVVKPNKIKAGRHHGKDFIIVVGDWLAEYSQLSGLYESVTNIAFGPTQKRRAKLCLDRLKNRYVINIYADDNQGTGVQIVLTADKYWMAVIEAKCIFSTVRHLGSYKLTIDDLPPVSG